MTARFITIPQSHYCEKARWALDRWAVPYVEHPHLPVFSRIATRRYGGTTVPVLVLDDGTALSESTDILEHVDVQTTRTPRPFPSDGEQRERCKAWIARFDKGLGRATRVLAYDAIFRVPNLLRELTDAQGPALERKVGVLCAPLVVKLISRTYGITPARVKRSLEVTERTFAEVAAALADGRRYLCGDALSAADITFASLAAVVLYLPAYPFPLPDPSRLAPEDRDLPLRLRETVAGRFAARLYREERHPTE